MLTEDAHSPLCVGIGELLWDLLPSGKALGGAPVNVAAIAAQLGVRSAAVSAVGDDPEGREILQRLRVMGVDASGVQLRCGLPTGAVDVKLEAAGVPAYTIRAPAAWDAIAMDGALEGLADEAGAVVYGSLAQRDPRSRDAIQTFLRAVRPGCLKVFDVNLRRPFFLPQVILDSLELADVLKLNDQELPVLAEMLGLLTEDETARLKAIRKLFNLDLVVYTRGAGGSRMITAERDESHPVCPAEVEDTVGAGDAFTAAVTVGLLEGINLTKIQNLASRVAAFVCSRAGAVPRLPEQIVKEFRQQEALGNLTIINRQKSYLGAGGCANSETLQDIYRRPTENS